MNTLITEIKKYVTELKIPGINQSLKMKIEEAVNGKYFSIIFGT